MLLKSAAERIRTSTALDPYQKENAITLLRFIMFNYENPAIWRWKSKDHRMLLKHYQEVTDKIREINPTLDFDTAYDVINAL